jgi:predicted DNA-binding transcriptional regulator YafY
MKNFEVNIVRRRMALLDLLKASGATCTELGIILGVGPRCIMRDVKALRLMGHRIDGGRGRGGGLLLRPERKRA